MDEKAPCQEWTSSCVFFDQLLDRGAHVCGDDAIEGARVAQPPGDFPRVHISQCLQAVSDRMCGMETCLLPVFFSPDMKQSKHGAIALLALSGPQQLSAGIEIPYHCSMPA